MNGVAKFIVGGVLTSLMAMATHSTVSGAAFVDRLKGKADAAVAASGLPGVSAAFVDKPMLSRDIVVSGDASPAGRDRLIAALKDIPGVGSVTWPGGAAALHADADAPATAPATAKDTADASLQGAQDCQARVDAAAQGKDILFNTGQSSIDIGSGELLDTLAARLKDCSGIMVEVAGHTDAQGAADINMALSQRRAQAVVTALVERGVPADRLTARGYGETLPRVPTGPDEARAENRRIEFKAAPATAAG